MKYTRTWLESEVENGKRIKYLHFWGHQPGHEGTISASCFSQWWEGHAFDEGGIRYPTTEHYMMAGKARLFEDQHKLHKILLAPSPAEAKKWGRAVQHFDIEAWRAHRCEIVIQGNWLKFSQHDPLKELLLKTQDRILVEASPLDPIWGIGMAKDDPNAANPTAWKGDNLLGFCLMEVRDRLRSD